NRRDRRDDHDDVRSLMGVVSPVREPGDGEHADHRRNDREEQSLAGPHAGLGARGTATTITSMPSPFSMIRSITEPRTRRRHHVWCVWPMTASEIPFSR